MNDSVFKFVQVLGNLQSRYNRCSAIDCMFHGFISGRKFRGWCLSLSSVVCTLLRFKLGDEDQVLADLMYSVSGKALGTNVHD